MIASLFFFLGHAFAMDAPDCYKLLNFEMERQSMGNFFAPKGEKNVPEGVMGGVQNTFEQLQASEKLFSEKRKAHEKISHVPFEKTKEGELLAIQADNLKNRFEPWDLVYLGVGGDFTQTLDYKTKQNSIRVYLLNRKVEALQTFMSVSSEIRPLPLLVEVNGDCKVTTFHYLHPSRYENRKPSKTYHSSAFYLLQKIKKTAPLISMSTANSQPDELCEVG
ncbi:MAG: hypothetical protein KDD25_07675, partial [Bdellovibrionales bacterium]|nr:hypothetical protein [Bdellovibrionales bacterium]